MGSHDLELVTEFYIDLILSFFVCHFVFIYFFSILKTLTIVACKCCDIVEELVHDSYLLL